MKKYDNIDHYAVKFTNPVCLSIYQFFVA